MPKVTPPPRPELATSEALQPSNSASATTLKRRSQRLTGTDFTAWMPFGTWMSPGFCQGPVGCLISPGTCHLPVGWRIS